VNLACRVHETVDIFEILDSWLNVQIVDHMSKVTENEVKDLNGGNNCANVLMPSTIYNSDTVSLVHEIFC
jgi:hypothetical protein